MEGAGWRVGGGGGALQWCCKGSCLSLIGCFAIRKLGGEDKLALYNNQAQDGPGMLCTASQEAFLKTEARMWAKAQIANSHRHLAVAAVAVNSFQASTVERRPDSQRKKKQNNELSAFVAVTN